MRRQTTTKMQHFFKNHWLKSLLFLLSAFFILPLLIRYVGKQIEKLKEQTLANETALTTATIVAETTNNNVENSQANPDKLKQKSAIVKKKYPKIPKAKLLEIEQHAHLLAIALGTNANDRKAILGMDGYLPDINISVSGNFEDEKEAIRILKKFPGTYPVLAEFYYKVATRSHNLTSDIKEYLSKSEVQQVRTHYKKYKYTWL
jgi:hypothetical protein